ncbi:MAG TPA: sigma-54 dependent transcriptional regulator [Kofleriaceae bacterium]|nr:sigma-54 dependent transcriptional regulator [Kofleriaceae bacterium]
MAQILIADDEPKLGKLVVEMLTAAGHQAAHVAGGKAAVEWIKSTPPDIVLTDLRMPDIDGLAVLRESKKLAPGTDVVMMTAHATAQNAVEAMRLGATDYLIKPFAMEELRMRIARIAERRELATRANALARHIDEREGFGKIVGQSAKMRAIVAQAHRVAPTDETVLLLGESGTGKSLLARAIHNASHRATGPFVEVHAAALPESLVEGELFGREKGAYTGATEAKAGHAEAASGGTLFLDEIGELPMATQVKLLRLLQDRSFTRLGSTQQRKADVRIIAATNRDLEAAVKAGTFREDLYYRLAVFPLVVPPLRDRPDDIASMVRSLLAARGLGPDRISDEALVAMSRYSWPGNVRELENALTRALVLSGTDPIGLAHLPAAMQQRTGHETTQLDDLLIPGFSLDNLERDIIHHALVKASGNKAAAARLLGITRRRLYSRLESIGRAAEAEEPDEPTP